ncbi:MAG: helix-turn-helix domain-containing protein [Rariglobus sp.]|nr:AraC family transcriptional regulator [Rariglobus sp.]
MTAPLTYPLQSVRLHARGFSADYSFPPHRLPLHQFYYVLAGEVSQRVENHTHRLRANEGVWIAPGLEREPRALGAPGTYLVVEFTAPDSFLPQDTGPGKKCTLRGTAARDARALADLGTVSDDDHRAAVLFHHLCLLALPEALLASPRPAGNDRATSNRDQTLTARVERIERMMTENTAHPLSLEEIAGLAGMSRSALARLFLACRGCAPCARFREIRLERAKELLATGGRSVTQVAMETGFASSQHFAGAFRRRFGRTPSSFTTTTVGK